MKIELLQNCSAGKKGAVIDVADDIGEELRSHCSAKIISDVGSNAAPAPASTETQQDKPVTKGRRR